MRTNFIIAGLICVAATGAFAFERGEIQKTVPLKDGSTVYIFTDGKMAMEDALGRVVAMNDGLPMQAKDGQTIRMVGNETARLDQILKARVGGP